MPEDISVLNVLRVDPVLIVAYSVPYEEVSSLTMYISVIWYSDPFVTWIWYFADRYIVELKLSILTSDVDVVIADTLEINPLLRPKPVAVAIPEISIPPVPVI